MDSNFLGLFSFKIGFLVVLVVDEGLISGYSDWFVGSEESKGY